MNDHSILETRHWEPGFGPCFCQYCRKLPYYIETKMTRPEIDDKYFVQTKHNNETAKMSLPTPETIVDMVIGLVTGIDAKPSIVCLPVTYGTMLDTEYDTPLGAVTLRMQLLRTTNIKGIALHSGKGVYLKAVQ